MTPPSQSDQWSHFKQHGTLIQDNDPGGDILRARGGGVGGNAGSVSVPPPHGLFEPDLDGQIPLTDTVYPVYVPAMGTSVPSILRGEFNGSVYKGVPGSGLEPTNPDCGNEYGWSACEHGDHKYPLLRTCGRPECPICYGAWLHRAVERIAERLYAWIDLYDWDYDWCHISSSPGEIPKDLSPIDQCRWVLNTFHSQMKDLGIVATSVYVHPWRIWKEMRRLVNDAATKEGMNRYQWAFAQDNWMDYVSWSPHVHAHTQGKLRTTGYYAKTGWVLKNHGPRMGPGLKANIAYILSHAWVVENPAAVRYWGTLSTVKMGCETTESRDFEKCRKCGGFMRFVPQGWDPVTQLKDTVCREVTKITRRYFIRAPGPPISQPQNKSPSS